MFRNAKLVTLFYTMIVVMVGFGKIIPILPFDHNLNLPL